MFLFSMPILMLGLVAVRSLSKGNKPDCFEPSLLREFGARLSEQLGPTGPISTSEGTEVQLQQMTDCHGMCGMYTHAPKHILVIALISRD